MPMVMPLSLFPLTLTLEPPQAVAAMANSIPVNARVFFLRRREEITPNATAATIRNWIKRRIQCSEYNGRNSAEVRNWGKCRHKTPPKARNPKKTDNIPLHQPVPKPVASASPKNSLIFCSITLSLSLGSDGEAGKEFSVGCLQHGTCILLPQPVDLSLFNIG